MNLTQLPELIRERVIDCLDEDEGCVMPDLDAMTVELCDYHEGILAGWDMRGDHDG